MKEVNDVLLLLLVLFSAYVMANNILDKRTDLAERKLAKCIEQRDEYRQIIIDKLTPSTHE